jgi:Flp pilus assembly protein TadD
LREAISLSPDDSLAHYNYGLSLLLGEKLDQAIGQFRITLRLQPDDPDTLYYLGRALLKKHEPAEAAGLVRQAEVNADDAHAYNALAVALAGTRDLAGARSQLQRAQAIEPGSPLYKQNLRCLEQEMRNCELGF